MSTLWKALPSPIILSQKAAFFSQASYAWRASAFSSIVDLGRSSFAPPVALMPVSPVARRDFLKPRIIAQAWLGMAWEIVRFLLVSGGGFCPAANPTVRGSRRRGCDRPFTGGVGTGIRVTRASIGF